MEDEDNGLTQPSSQYEVPNASRTESRIDPEAWGVLLSTKTTNDVYQLKQSEITIGRKKTNTISIKNTKISGTHCIIRCHPIDNQIVFILDKSANGTWLNNTQIIAGQKKRLSSGDQISLSYPPGSPHAFAEFVFKSTKVDIKTFPEEITSKYIIGKELGRGTYGEVRLVVDELTNKSYAIKIIPKNRLSLPTNNLIQEAKVLSALHCPYITALREILESKDHMYIVMELIDGGELFEKLANTGKYSEPDAKKICWRILKAVEYMHDNKVVHRDLKPENILLTRNDKTMIKITDFGLAKMVTNESNLTTFCGTMQYLAPEVLLRNNNPNDLNPYDSSVDLWSCGVIFFNILSATSPFSNDSLNNQILNAMYSYNNDPTWKNISSNAKDLIDHLIVKDPTQRYTASQALEHPWFKDVILKDLKKEYNEFIDQYQTFGPNCPTPDLDSYLLKSDESTDIVSDKNKVTRSNPLPITSSTAFQQNQNQQNDDKIDEIINSSGTPLDKKSQSEELSQIVGNMTFNSPTLLSQNTSQFVQLPPDSQPSQPQQPIQPIQPIQQPLSSILESNASLMSLSLSLDNDKHNNEEVRSSISSNIMKNDDSTTTTTTTPATTPVPTPTTSNPAIIEEETDETENEDDKVKRGRNENVTKVKLVKDINGAKRKRQKINQTKYSSKTTVGDDEIEDFDSD